MDKKAYTQANKEWLQQKSREKDVKPLSKGIYYKVLSEGKPFTTRAGRLTVNNLTAVAAKFR